MLPNLLEWIQDMNWGCGTKCIRITFNFSGRLSHRYKMFYLQMIIAGSGLFCTFLI
ncbi:hypothetical protein [Lysinibacillus parviboronicapiens]|uniref:hypothetical protein n=1 Tax=Lysinibacillus parviboronicapiens TaxID=436516 RepID=UPI001EE7622F|nr:hypothetical protein [Lysinibacillus parviboronicapiens]